MTNDKSSSSGHGFNEHVNKILFVMFLLVLFVLLIKGCETSFPKLEGRFNSQHELGNGAPSDSSHSDSLLYVR